MTSARSSSRCTGAAPRRTPRRPRRRRRGDVVRALADRARPAGTVPRTTPRGRSRSSAPRRDRVPLVQRPLQRARLRDVPREPVQDESRTPAAPQAIHEHPDDDVVRHEVTASMYDLASDAELVPSATFPRRMSPVEMCAEAVAPGEASRLGPLSGSRGPEQDSLTRPSEVSRNLRSGASTAGTRAASSSRARRRP